MSGRTASNVSLFTRFHVVFDLVTVGLVSTIPLLLLPLLMPLPEHDSSWLNGPSGRFAQGLLHALESFKAYLTMGVLAVVGALYWAGSITLEFEEEEENENNFVVVE